jgi:hypothetical protein
MARKFKIGELLVLKKDISVFRYPENFFLLEEKNERARLYDAIAQKTSTKFVGWRNHAIHTRADDIIEAGTAAVVSSYDSVYMLNNKRNGKAAFTMHGEKFVSEILPDPNDKDVLTTSISRYVDVPTELLHVLINERIVAIHEKRVVDIFERAESALKRFDASIVVQNIINLKNVNVADVRKIFKKSGFDRYNVRSITCKKRDGSIEELSVDDFISTKS